MLQPPSYTCTSCYSAVTSFVHYCYVEPTNTSPWDSSSSVVAAIACSSRPPLPLTLCLNSVRGWEGRSDKGRVKGKEWWRGEKVEWRIKSQTITVTCTRLSLSLARFLSSVHFTMLVITCTAEVRWEKSLSWDPAGKAALYLSFCTELPFSFLLLHPPSFSLHSFCSASFRFRSWMQSGSYRSTALTSTKCPSSLLVPASKTIFSVKVVPENKEELVLRGKWGSDPSRSSVERRRHPISGSILLVGRGVASNLQ